MTSGLSLLFTFIVYYLSQKLKAEEYFVFFFSLSNIINIYISGLVSLICLAKPYFISHGIYQSSELPTDEIAYYAGLIFFISLTNNTIFKNLVVDKDIKAIWKVIKDIVRVIRG